MAGEVGLIVDIVVSCFLNINRVIPQNIPNISVMVQMAELSSFLKSEFVSTLIPCIAPSWSLTVYFVLLMITSQSSDLQV